MSSATARQRAQRRAFGDRVRAVRTSRGLSQEGLADKADLHRTYVGSVERGERNVSLDNIYRLADALGVTARDSGVRLQPPPRTPPTTLRRGVPTRTGAIRLGLASQFQERQNDAVKRYPVVRGGADGITPV